MTIGQISHSTLASLLDVPLPEDAVALATELEDMLEGTGSHASLKVTAAIATAAIAKDAAMFRALTVLACDRFAKYMVPRALAVATCFLHPPPQPPRDATTKLVTAALERALRAAPSVRNERVDPLLAACTDVVEMVNALSVARFAAALMPATVPHATPAPISVPSPSSDERRRITRDFPAPETPRAEPVRSTMRPAPPRSTMRPTAARGTLRPGAPTDVDPNAVLVPRTQVRDVAGRPLKKKW
jgi:hypothetical protein